jgi:phasin family protein
MSKSKKEQPQDYTQAFQESANNFQKMFSSSATGSMMPGINQQFSQAAEIASKTSQTLLESQKSMMQANMSEAQKFTQQLMSAPQETIKELPAYIQQQVEQAVSETRNMCEMLVKSSMDIVEKMTKGVTEVMSDIMAKTKI